MEFSPSHLEGQARNVWQLKHLSKKWVKHAARGEEITGQNDGKCSCSGYIAFNEENTKLCNQHVQSAECNIVLYSCKQGLLGICRRFSSKTETAEQHSRLKLKIYVYYCIYGCRRNGNVSLFPTTFSPQEETVEYQSYILLTLLYICIPTRK